MAHVDRKQYWKIFVLLAVLTAIEVGVAWIPGLSKKILVTTLVALALGKAGIVGFYFMHLGHETKPMKLTVVLPFAAPALYALVLISEAAWRLYFPEV